MIARRGVPTPGRQCLKVSAPRAQSEADRTQTTMTPNSIPPPARRRTRWGLFVVVVMTLLLLPVALLGVGVVRCLHVNRDTGALRNSVLKSASGEWDKTIEISTGPVMWGLARAGLAFVDVPVEARTALRAIRGAEVGVYRLHEGSTPPNYAASLVETDKTMTARGWSRLVGVLERDQMVAIYVPEDTRTARDLRVCLVVLTDRDMVIASARSNLEPLLELALSRSEELRLGKSPVRL